MNQAVMIAAIALFALTIAANLTPIPGYLLISAAGVIGFLGGKGSD